MAFPHFTQVSGSFAVKFLIWRKLCLVEIVGYVVGAVGIAGFDGLRGFCEVIVVICPDNVVAANLEVKRRRGCAGTS